eukprot:138133_1
MAFNWSFSGTDLQNDEAIVNNIIPEFRGFSFADPKPTPNHGETNVLSSKDNPDTKDEDKPFTFRFNPQQSRNSGESSRDIDDNKHQEKHQSFGFGVPQYADNDNKPSFSSWRGDRTQPSIETPPLFRINISEKLVGGYIRNIDIKEHVPKELVHLCLQFTQLIGTKHIVFEPTSESGRYGKILTFQHLSALAELTHVSLEELRYEDLYGVPAMDHNVCDKVLQQPPVFQDMTKPFILCDPVAINKRRKTLPSRNEDKEDNFCDAINTLMDQYSRMKIQLSDYHSKLRNKDMQLEILKRKNAILEKQNAIYKLEMDQLKAKYDRSNSTQSIWNMSFTTTSAQKYQKKSYIGKRPYPFN